MPGAYVRFWTYFWSGWNGTHTHTENTHLVHWYVSPLKGASWSESGRSRPPWHLRERGVRKTCPEEKQWADWARVAKRAAPKRVGWMWAEVKIVRSCLGPQNFHRMLNLNHRRWATLSKKQHMRNMDATNKWIGMSVSPHTNWHLQLSQTKHENPIYNPCWVGTSGQGFNKLYKKLSAAVASFEAGQVRLPLPRVQDCGFARKPI